MKKYIIGFVLGAVVMVAGSVGAVDLHLVPVQYVPLVKALEVQKFETPAEAQKILTPEEQIAKGYKYNMYTGEKLLPELNPLEKRLQAIEERLAKLEAKKN